MERIECVANYNKRNKTDAKLKNSANVINFCCDKVVINASHASKDTGKIMLVSKWLKYFDRKLYSSDFDW